VNAVAGRLRAAASVADVLESTKTFAPAVSADALRLELAPAQVNLGSDLNAVWMSPGLAAYNGHARDVPGLLRARFDLPDQLGNLELEWIDGRGEIDRDHAVAAEALCRNIASAVRRIVQRKLQRRSVAPRSKE
jgi:hypothetical protein